MFAVLSTFIQMKTLKILTNTKSITIFILFFYLWPSVIWSRIIEYWDQDKAVLINTGVTMFIPMYAVTNDLIYDALRRK